MCGYRNTYASRKPPQQLGNQGTRQEVIMGENHARVEYNTDGKKIGMSVYNFNTLEELQEFRERVAEVHRSMMSDEKTILIKDVKKAS